MTCNTPASRSDTSEQFNAARASEAGEVDGLTLPNSEVTLCPIVEDGVAAVNAQYERISGQIDRNLEAFHEWMDMLKETYTDRMLRAKEEAKVPQPV
jgi:hypothetical protein